MKKNKQRLFQEALDFLLCVMLATVLALAIDAHIRQVVSNVINDCQHTEWVKAARQVTTPSSVIPGGYDSNK